MLRTPAFTAAIAPSSPCACASTGTFLVAGFLHDRAHLFLAVDLLARIGIGGTGAVGRENL